MSMVLPKRIVFANFMRKFLIFPEDRMIHRFPGRVPYWACLGLAAAQNEAFIPTQLFCAISDCVYFLLPSPKQHKIRLFLSPFSLVFPYKIVMRRPFV